MEAAPLPPTEARQWRLIHNLAHTLAVSACRPRCPLVDLQVSMLSFAFTVSFPLWSLVSNGPNSTWDAAGCWVPSSRCRSRGPPGGNPADGVCRTCLAPATKVWR
eukprot:TRINITY_DN1783_c2_g3_i1.p4 TRINITY_DN1783_c2_g3~~TRINITY_DN1783_c2_g3_i1.p4  ORF type:complete len:105 (+),score=5.35 TRINITY_DN1783_c2_g3_i1:193-507(+)